jgi:hypothetical protein
MLGYDYLISPFDNFKSGRKIIKPFTEILERSFLRFFGANIAVVLRKR